MTTNTDLVFQIDAFVASMEDRYFKDEILDALSEYLDIADELSF